MKIDFDKAYNPSKHEPLIYKNWEKSGFFNPDNLNIPKNAQSYTIILPPPNITAKLHLGHSAMLAIEDLLIRYKRLNGFRTLWLPGTDHAAIATQNVVERKILQERSLTKHDLGKDKFLQEIWSFLKETQGEILEQIKKMGASLDWSRLAFTLDEDRKKAVQQMFKDMYDEGVIYQGERIVNWCPRCHSTLADDEVEYKEENSRLYWIKYGPFVLATTRPETKLGDTAVAVHPDDVRYHKLIGQDLEIMGVLGKFLVKVVADEAVDMNFGSGAIKVTPAHSFIDNEIAHRHNLPSKKIINEQGLMMENCGKYAGLPVSKAREEIIKDMQMLKLIDHIDDNYQHNSARCYRCDTIIEPLPSKQWFVSVNKKIEKLGNKSLKEAALEVAESGEVEFIPSRFKKRYLDWMENLHDWCISRQIWFGHQIPVWYKDKEVFCGLNPLSEDGWIQDPDTLDTWFSSGMWTFSTLGWPHNYQNGKKIKDLANFHPTQVLETGYEIITLWVSRMIMMSLFALKEVPFSKVYLHGMVLDQNGKKMSKSKGNGIDPIEMINKFGADSVRLSLLMGVTPGNDTKFSEERIESKRNFINKLWNISRFILSGLNEKNDNKDDNISISLSDIKTAADFWIIKSFQETINAVNKNLEEMNFSLAADALNDFTWNKLADWYLEISKIEKKKDKILLYILKNLLILWHPFIPFVTETIWAKFNDKLLMVENWPQIPTELSNYIINQEGNSISEFAVIQDLIIAIRNARSEHKIEPGKKLEAIIYTKEKNDILEKNKELIIGLKTGIKSVDIKSEKNIISGAINIITSETEVYLLGVIDLNKEKERLEKDLNAIKQLIQRQEIKLTNQDFVNKAPKNIVIAEKQKLDNFKKDQEKIEKLILSL